MARSTYIYVVAGVNSRSIIAAFTVKHEMVSWLNREWRRRESGPESVRALKVSRYPDGGHGTGTFLGNALEFVTES